MRNFYEYAFYVLGEEYLQEAGRDFLQAIAEQRRVSHDNDTEKLLGFHQLQNYKDPKIHRIIDNLIKRQYIIACLSREDCFKSMQLVKRVNK